MSAPEHLRGLVERKKETIETHERELDELLPLLRAQKLEKKIDGVSVVHYSGIDGMKTVMDMAFYCKSKKWNIIAPYVNFLREYDKDYAQRYLRARKYYGITSRALWEKRAQTRKLSAQEIKERNPRVMPSVMHGRFKSMMIIFDDKIAIFSSYEKLSAILITSKELHGMFLAIFEGLWEVSERYE
ncbi:MAG TPA: hypothetical protein VN495_00565, partial [Candidatus Paceibacterota bacterium]|nr:hypothetical protein [Candidatus Paceibacterota bacterium]